MAVNEDARLLEENSRLAYELARAGERADLEHERAKRLRDLLASTESQARSHLERRLTVENEVARLAGELELARQRIKRLEEMLDAKSTA